MRARMPAPANGFDGFRAYALEQLGRVRPVTTRRMFGAVGIYADALFFAVLDDDALWLKTDDTNRPDFEAAGSEPFRPYGPDGPPAHYWRVPEEVLEDAETLPAWVEKAVAVARAARSAKAKGARQKGAGAKGAKQKGGGAKGARAKRPEPRKPR